MLDFSASAAGYTVFSKIDLQKGYGQITVNPKDVQKTAINTPSTRGCLFASEPTTASAAWDTARKSACKAARDTAHLSTQPIFSPAQWSSPMGSYSLSAPHAVTPAPAVALIAPAVAAATTAVVPVASTIAPTAPAAVPTAPFVVTPTAVLASRPGCPCSGPDPPSCHPCWPWPPML